jgi:hypothetical protein
MASKRLLPSFIIKMAKNKNGSLAIMMRKRSRNGSRTMILIKDRKNEPALTEMLLPL